MKIGDVYLDPVNKKKYEIHTLNPMYGSATAINIYNSSDIITITDMDLLNNCYALDLPVIELPAPVPEKPNCGNFHYWRRELNFQFETEYCHRCGVKRGEER